MLEEACCVPLVDVQNHRQEEMHTSILPWLERLRMPTEGRFHLLNCDFYRSCYASDVTAIEHSCVAMDLLVVVRKAGILLA